MKKFSIILSIIITSMLVCIAVSASSTAAIVQTAVYSDRVTAYVNVAGIDDCTVQLGTELCNVLSCNPVSETETKTLILVDASGSVPNEVRAKIAELLELLIENKNDNESYSIAEFGTEVKLLCDYTTDRYDLSKAVKGINFDEKYTYLYSVLNNELKDFSPDNFGRIILISDGIENSKNGITYDELILDVKNSNHLIYTIGFENSNQESLKKLFAFSRQTNAESFTIDAASDVNDICNIINSDRNYTCITAKIPAELADGSIRHLRISGKDFECGTDIHTVQTKTESETVPVISKTEAITEETILSSQQDNVIENKEHIPYLFIIIPFAAVIVICIAVIAVLSRKKKKIASVINENEPREIKTSKQEAPSMPDQGHTKRLFDIANTTVISETDATVILTENESSVTKIVIKLTDTNNPSKIYRYAINDGIVIGRNSSEAMIAVDDKYVSRQHCRIYERDGKAYIENLSTQNHTYVNDKAVDTGMLANGDVIRIGKTSFRFEYVK